MKVFIIAGEPSGDKLGAALMAGLKRLTGASFTGIGGPLMEAEGMESLFPMDEISLMGLAEILPKYADLKRRIAELAGTIVAQQPDVLITIDSPDFCLRVAQQVKAQSTVPTVHYVAPTVWAWRAGRAEKMAQHIDHVLALFPFEPPLMTAAGMSCDFVGHPVVADPIATDADAAAFRAAHDLTDKPLILALPGSRRGEVSRLIERFRDTLHQVIAVQPEARVVLPCAGPVYDMVRKHTRSWDIAPILIAPDDPAKAAAFQAADVALAASGTVSLELAATETPMVIGYDMAWLSRIAISFMLKVDTVTLVNLVSQTRTVPEFIGKHCVADDMATALVNTLRHPDTQLDAMRATMSLLGKGGEEPGLRAARSVFDFVTRIQDQQTAGQ